MNLLQALHEAALDCYCARPNTGWAQRLQTASGIVHVDQKALSTACQPPLHLSVRVFPAIPFSALYRQGDRRSKRSCLSRLDPDCKDWDPTSIDQHVARLLTVEVHSASSMLLAASSSASASTSMPRTYWLPSAAAPMLSMPCSPVSQLYHYLSARKSQHSNSKFTFCLSLK